MMSGSAICIRTGGGANPTTSLLPGPQAEIKLPEAEIKLPGSSAGESAPACLLPEAEIELPQAETWNSFRQKSNCLRQKLNCQIAK